MPMRFFSCLFPGLLCFVPVFAQRPLPVPRNIQAAIARGTRTATGQPGSKYWQNRADYSIQVRFDPKTRLVSGTESIVYTNNSPDTLRQLLFKLYPNLYKKGASRLQSIRPDDVTDGVTVSGFSVEGTAGNFPSGVSGTDATIRVPAMAPGQSRRVSLGLGINETKYAWMDEGWASIGEWVISPMIDSTVVDLYGIGEYSAGAGKENDLPIITLSTQESGATYFLNAYAKPAMGYAYAMDLLGDSLLRKGLHRYIRDWHGKHPIPLDFFGCMNAGSGRNLNWFWRRWFYDDGYPDLAIKEVRHKGKAALVVVTNKGGKPLPVDLSIEFADGSRKNIHRSVGVWEKGNAETVVPVGSEKVIAKISLGSVHVSDSNPGDNVWPVAVTH